jgi:hypothetical protein
MRASWRGILAVASLALLVGFYGSQIWIVATQPKHQSYYRHAQSSTKDIIHPESAEERTADYTEALADYTKALAIVTAVLAVISLVQIFFLIRADRTARITADAARAAATEAGRAADIAAEQVAITRSGVATTERAYVFCESITHVSTAKFGTEEVVKWVFFAVWKNSGKTPTRRGLSVVNKWHAVNKGDLPNRFDFPDYASPERIIIGPNATMHSSAFEFTVEELDQIRSGFAKCYIWGWIDYNDVFEGTERHRSEFCFEIVVTGNPIYRAGGFLYPRRGPFNGFDDECMRKPGESPNQ